MPQLTRKEQEIYDRAVTRVRNHQRSEAEVIDSINEVDCCRLYEKFDKTSLHEFCVEVLKLGDESTYYFIAVARRSRKIPELKTAIEEGRTTASKAARVMSVMTEDNKDHWLDVISNNTSANIRKAVAEERPEPPKKAVVKPTGPDRSRISFDASDEFVELLKRAKELQKNNDVPEVLLKTLCDFVERKDHVKKADRAMAREKKKSARAEKSTSDRIPAASLHVVHARDRGKCQERTEDGICGKSGYTETHHIIRRADGGSHEPENLTTLCHMHHSRRHEVDKFTI